MAANHKKIDDYPFRDHGPTATLFPPLPHTLWWLKHLNSSQKREAISSKDSPDLHIWTLPLALEAGEYDVAFISNNPNELPLCQVYTSPDHFLGEVTPRVLGERLDVNQCVRLSLQEPSEGVRIGARTADDSLGILLIPRLGRIWPGGRLEHKQESGTFGQETRSGGWHIGPADFCEGYLVYGPYVPLESGDYVAHFRIACQNYMGNEEILSLEVVSGHGTNELIQLTISHEHIRKDGEFQEFALSFNLEKRLEDVEFRMRTMVPADIKIANVRLMTPADLIAERYFELGGVDSALGPITGAPYPAAPSKYSKTRGWLQRFSGGTIYWSRKFGAFEVYGEIGRKFEEKGGTSSVLGFPRTFPRQVTSSYGTKGYLQQFEEYDGNAAVYVCHWPWGASGHEVHGGIASDYFQILGGFEGPLGFPMTDEFTVSQDEEHIIRRSNFEGGFVEWGWQKGESWKRIRTVRYPRPKLHVEVSDQIWLGESIRIRLEAVNEGGEAEQGYLTISFPDPISGEPLVESDGDVRIGRAGDESHGHYGHKGFNLQYPRVEALYFPWQAETGHWLAVEVQPSNPAKFRIQARTTLGRIEKYEHVGIYYEGDPVPVGGHPMDHQNERVYEFVVTVKEKLLPNPVLVKTEIPSLVMGDEDMLKLRIRNEGTGSARQVRVRISEKLGGEESAAILLLPPGQEETVELDIIPKRSGNVRVKFHILYEDDYEDQYERVIETRMSVVRPGMDRPTFIIHDIHDIQDSVIIHRSNNS